jgi:hypothetical protein
VNHAILCFAMLAIAQPEPDWGKAGIAGFVVYGLVALGTAWIEAHRDAGHRDDCATLLREIRTDVETLLERDSGHSPKP